jgi:hypothetical protein
MAVDGEESAAFTRFPAQQKITSARRDKKGKRIREIPFWSRNRYLASHDSRNKSNCSSIVTVGHCHNTRIFSTTALRSEAGDYGPFGGGFKLCEMSQLQLLLLGASHRHTKNTKVVEFWLLSILGIVDISPRQYSLCHSCKRIG